MQLTEEQLEQFAQGVAYGFTPVGAAEEIGLSLSPIEAKALASSPAVRARVEKITQEGNVDLSLEHIRVAHQLEVDRDFAYRLGNPAAAINATVQRAKVLGVYVERYDTNARVAVSSPTELTPEEWAAKFGSHGASVSKEDEETA